MPNEVSFFLVDDGRSMPRWCQQAADPATGETTWVDAKGARRSCVSCRPVAHVMAANLDEVMRTAPDVVADLEKRAALAFLIDPESDQGWVAPDGRFYGCKFFQHDDVAYALVRKTVGEMEREGWLRVHASSVRSGSSRDVTGAQRRTLDELGFDDPSGYWVRTPAPDGVRRPPARAVKAARQPAPETRAVPDPKAADVRALVGRLARESEAMAGWEPGSYEVFLDFGGRWTWMAVRDDVSIGGEEFPNDVTHAPGIDLTKTSTDTVEVNPWPDAGVRLGPGVHELLAGFPSPSPSP